MAFFRVEKRFSDKSGVNQTLPNQQEQECRLTSQCFATDYSALKEFVSKYDAFQDLPFSQGQVYVAADALFPDSRFILTERDPDAWFDSLSNFHKKVFGIEDLERVDELTVAEKFNYLYPGYMRDYK